MENSSILEIGELCDDTEMTTDELAKTTKVKCEMYLISRSL